MTDATVTGSPVLSDVLSSVGDPVGVRRRPAVALLVDQWGSRTEAGWITRQVAGALANFADVHVVSLGGTGSTTSRESVFTVHHLGPTLSPTAELRRDLLIDALSTAGGPSTELFTPSLTALLDRGLVEPWNDASLVLKAVQPELVVIAGHQSIGALAAVDAFDREVPVSLLALGSSTTSLVFPRFRPLVERAASILVVTEQERQALVETYGDETQVHRVGAPLGINLSALREPHPWVSGGDYVLVLARSHSTDDQDENRLCRLIRNRFPEHSVGIVHTDAFIVWRNGRAKTGWPIERSSDLARLLAFARVTVDLRPGDLFSRNCLESLLYGNPIVVPAHSRAREHADRGRGGLWYRDAVELTWCLEAIFDPSVGAALGDQGRSYAVEEYGSTDAFIERVRSSCRIDLPTLKPEPA